MKQLANRIAGVKWVNRTTRGRDLIPIAVFTFPKVMSITHWTKPLADLQLLGRLSEDEQLIAYHRREQGLLIPRYSYLGSGQFAIVSFQTKELAKTFIENFAAAKDLIATEQNSEEYIKWANASIPHECYTDRLPKEIRPRCNRPKIYPADPQLPCEKGGMEAHLDIIDLELGDPLAIHNESFTGKTIPVNNDFKHEIIHSDQGIPRKKGEKTFETKMLPVNCLRRARVEMLLPEWRCLHQH